MSIFVINLFICAHILLALFLWRNSFRYAWKCKVVSGWGQVGSILCEGQCTKQILYLKGRWFSKCFHWHKWPRGQGEGKGWNKRKAENASSLIFNQSISSFICFLTGFHLGKKKERIHSQVAGVRMQEIFPTMTWRAPQTFSRVKQS